MLQRRAGIALVLVTVICVILPPLYQAADACTYCSAGHITVDNTGGYFNILVAISPDVAYNNDILVNIEEYFNRASQALFTATLREKGRYFRDVTVLVPAHWPTDARFSPATTESYSRAAFVVENVGKAWGSNPHTERSDITCGSGGDRIILPVEYLLSGATASMFGDIGKALVHEWGHYRYGVFDESRDEDGGEAVSCSGDPANTNKPPKCTAAISGKYIQADVNVSDMCIFLPNINQTVDASLMYAPYIDSVYTFCDDHNHNTDAYSSNNDQNRLCHGQSVWSVLRNHSDFSDSTPAASSAPPAVFRFVHENTQRIVIVMDTSGSMAENGRMNAMVNDVKDFLVSLNDGSKSTGIPVHVAMVEFAFGATVAHPLVLLNDTTLDSLRDAIPNVPVGGTCIGCGILRGVEILTADGCGKRGQLHVFTDGIENTSPFISDVRDDVCACNITVNGILFNDIAANHTLTALVYDTCGHTCMYDDTHATSMYDCLWTLTSYMSPTMTPVQIDGYVTPVAAGNDVSSSVVIEQDLGAQVTFRFSWPSSSPQLQRRRRRHGDEEDIRTWQASEDSLNERLAARRLRRHGNNERDYNQLHSTKDKSATNNKRRSRRSARSRRQVSGCDMISVVLTTPDGAVIQPGSPGYLSESMSIDIDASSVLSGSWSYIIRNPSTVECDVRVTVESFPAPNTSVTQLTTNIPKTKVILNPANPIEDNLIPLYVTLRKDSLPIGRAQVFADVTGNASTVTLELLDNGVGADFRANDGIYSRYFNEFTSNGAYSVRFRAKGLAGNVVHIEDERSYGSGTPPLPDYRVTLTSMTSPADAFQRSVAGGYIEISGYSAGSVVYPPSRIIDLVATSENFTIHTVRVTWTATGSSLDTGTASHYDMRISATASELTNNFDQAIVVTAAMIDVGDLTTPQPAGQGEIFVLDLAGTVFVDLDTPYYVAVKAVNDQGVQSELSNVAMFMFEDKQVCTPEEGGCH